MDLYRAIPSSRLEAARKGLGRQSTIRIPSNVPYIVDNLWEWLRPEGRPSRRHAIYASPTAELALANANGPLSEGECYIACRVVVDTNQIQIAHLAVRDAREHSDIRLVGRWVSAHGEAFAGLGLAQKQQLALLFMPGLRREELETLHHSDSLVADLCEYVRQVSTFWPSAQAEIGDSEGELFFELQEHAAYYLDPL
mgnify:CR=1 FL=1